MVVLINYLLNYFDNSNYHWSTEEPVTQLEYYKPGNVLYLYENGVVYFNELEYCKSKEHDKIAIEYVLAL